MLLCSFGLRSVREYRNGRINARALNVAAGSLHRHGMITTKLDLTGLKCPLPALKTRKALKSVKPGDRLEVYCTDPLSVIDIPHLIAETGDWVEITERAEHRIVFLIEKASGLVPAVAPSQPGDRDG
jgi:tRNA 2-thiouridine synthesizing protein A